MGGVARDSDEWKISPRKEEKRRNPMGGGGGDGSGGGVCESTFLRSCCQTQTVRKGSSRASWWFAESRAGETLEPNGGWRKGRLGMGKKGGRGGKLSNGVGGDPLAARTV